MASVPARALLLGSLGFVLGAGCKPDPFRPDAGPPRDTAPPPWWQPNPGEAADWDIQLAAPFDVSMPRAMYTIDLWDAVPAPTMLDYGTGTPGPATVTVPAGALAGKIAELHARTPATIVVCHVGTGAIRLDDPDAVKFPGYVASPASPPNRPTPPAAGSVIGWSITVDDPNQRFIDIHESTRSIVAPLIGKRIELAKTIGCDAIAAEHNDLPIYEIDKGGPGHGFSPVPFTEYVSWSNELSSRAHDLKVSIGQRNGTGLETDATSLAYDWLMVDRCAEYNLGCAAARPFLNKRKSVFAIEYYKAEDEVSDNNTTALCGELTFRGIEDGIIKTAELSSVPTVTRCP
jgi:hypothetical protein